MEQKERLINLIIESVGGCARNWAEVIADHLLANGVVVIDTDVVSMKNRPLISTVASLPIDEVIDLVKAKEEGRLIVPPCKVGDTVYFIQDKKIYEGVIILIRPFIHKENTVFHGNVKYECEDPFYNDGRTMTHEVFVVFQEYGKNLIAYFTREEAEKALAERSKE